MSKHLFTIAILLAVSLGAFGQTQGTSMRATNGIGFGVTILNGRLEATNINATNIIAGNIQGRGGLAQGQNSVAIGLNTRSSGTAGLTTGIGSVNAGSGAIVGGRSNTVSSSAPYSLVVGENNSASNPGSFVSGTSNSIEGSYSSAIGSAIRMESDTHRSVGLGQNIFIGVGTSNIFAWNSSTTNDLIPSVSDSFNVNAPGGIFLNGSVVSSTSNAYNGSFTGNGAGLTNIPQSALTGNLWVSNSANGTITNVNAGGVSILGPLTNSGPSKFTTNRSDQVLVGGAASGSDAVNVTGTLRVSSSIFGDFLQVGTERNMSWANRSIISSPENGTINLANSTVTAFSNLTFGPGYLQSNLYLSTNYPALRIESTTNWPALSVRIGTNVNAGIYGSLTVSNLMASSWITATNFLALPTNYVAANFVPVAGLVKIVSSNGAIFSVTQLSTNLIAGP